VALSVAEVRRLLSITGSDERQRLFRLHWSHFRRSHQAGAKRAHVQRRAAQLPRMPDAIPPPLELAGLPELTEERWERLLPLLPPQKPRTGRPAEDHYRIVSGIFFVMRTGCSWRQLPKHFGPWQTVADRYQRWLKEGRWAQILQCLLHEVPITSSA
jgi:Putative transposase of IS4/5 family (DUF4096)